MFASENRLAAVRRLILVLLILCAVTYAQAESLAAEHSHHASQHCCGLCHTGPLPFVPMSMGAAVLPSVAVIWLASFEESGGVPEQLASIESSRAPPA